MNDWCPWIKRECDPTCRFQSEGKCLVVEFLEFQIIQARVTMNLSKQMEPMFGAMRRIYGLPEEIKKQFPEDLKKQIEDIFKGLGDKKENG